MIRKQEIRPTGMRQDNLIGSSQSSNYAHEIKNLRFNTTGDYTTASWVTEQGTLYKRLIPTSNAVVIASNGRLDNFIPVGQAVINDQWVLFGKIGTNDYILKLWYVNDDLNIDVLYCGHLGFDVNYPLETLIFYENEQIQKVYWIDGKNQPRVINIAKPSEPNIDTQFDFIQEVELREQVTIEKDVSGAGLFPPSTVKYAITYYNKYGQETNVVYDSPLYYPVIGERGCSPEELSGDSFYIKINHLDLSHGFDYIRLYSIIRTTNDATPIVRIVEDKPLPVFPANTPQSTKDSYEIVFHDTNTTGEIVDPTIIQYVGGKEIIAHTFDQKDNTLFLGNIELTKKSVTNLLTNYLETLRNSTHEFTKNGGKRVIGTRRTKVNNDNYDYSVYQHINQLNQGEVWNAGSSSFNVDNGDSHKIKIFKYRETYRFGIQFQDNKGAWSEVVWIADETNNITPYTDEWNGECQFAWFKYVLPNSVRQVLVSNGYKKARIVCCYPTNADRTILAQGVIAPTVYNNRKRQGHSPDVMSSWFFRPNDKVVTDKNNFHPYVLPWQDGQKLDQAFYVNQENSGASARYNYKIVPEIQSTYHENTSRGDNDSDINDDSAYKVDRTVMTFHSPELEFDESLRTLPADGFTMHIIGKIPINSFSAKMYVEADTPAATYGGNRGNGLKGDSAMYSLEMWGSRYGTHCTLLGEWNDTNVYTKDGGKGWEPTNFCIYPFHRKSSLNNYIKDISDWECRKYNQHSGTADWPIKKTSTLHSKVLSHILYSTQALYKGDLDVEQQGFVVFDTNEVMPTKIVKSDGYDLIYYGNMNDISPLSTRLKDFTLVDADDDDYECSGSYPIGYYKERANGIIKFDINGSYTDDDADSARGVFSSDPVPITYKSTVHGVFYSQKITTADSQSNSTFPQTQRPFLWLAELRKTVDANTRFGGNPITNPNVKNTYVPCGPTVSLNTSGNINMYGLEGDTYYMRYDNLKTYPFADDDVNQIVEILSFMCETRINLDGRYDKNRGLMDNTNIINTNFNYVNKSYTQSNNTFTFRTLDELSSTLDKFANQITWTKTKTSGEDVDAWTNITLASVADADGTLGEITKILNINDKLWLFQDHGIAQIGYNERTALSTEAGIPLEIANSGKYTGLQYLTKTVGCQNKWSISNTKNGCLFIDDSRRELNVLSEQLRPISTLNGFDAFLIDNLENVPATWSPNQFTPSSNVGNFVSYYDKLSKDVYYINDKYCLAWNEITKTFTSFYDYQKVPYIANVGQHCLMLNLTNNSCSVYAARESNDYAQFFGVSKPYWITLLTDGVEAFPADKVFNVVEFRGDLFDEHSPVIETLPNSTSVVNAINMPLFTDIAAYNGYQAYKEFKIDGRNIPDAAGVSLDPIMYKEYPWKAERKFNIWRVIVPRATYTQPNGTLATGRDRIRNPFCYIKLINNNPDIGIDNTIPHGTHNHRAVLHDFAVYYDMK